MTDVTDTLAELVRIDSVNPEWGGPGESNVASSIRRFFDRAGIETWENPTLPGRNNVMARLNGVDPNRRIVLEAHMDTVSAHQMAFPPFQPDIENGRMRGRGSCDVKGGLAAMMHAFVAVCQGQTTPPCDVIFAAVVDEEHAYRGVVQLINSLPQGPRPEAAVVAEPTELRVVRANKGVLRWKIVTHGRAAHSSKPDLGHNAITDMARIILALEKHFQELEKTTHPLVGSATGSIGLIEGGTQINFVPERCEIKIDRRLLPGESAESALAQCDAVLTEVGKRYPAVQVEMEAPLLSDEAMETDPTSPVVETASRVLEQLGLNGEPVGVPFGCDGSKLSRAGIPTIIFGPGSIEQAHTANEFIELAQVSQSVDFYQKFILEFGRP